MMSGMLVSQSYPSLAIDGKMSTGFAATTDWFSPDPDNYARWRADFSTPTKVTQVEFYADYIEYDEDVHRNNDHKVDAFFLTLLVCLIYQQTYTCKNICSE